MATKTKRIEKSFSEFIERDGEIGSLEGLGWQTWKGIKAVSPKHVLEIHKDYGDYYASIKGAIDTERLLREILPLLIEEHKDQEWSRPILLSLRYKRHNIQFISGHLERNKKDELVPMHEVVEAQDETMLRRLVSISPVNSDNISKLVNHTISKLTSRQG